MKNDRYLLVSYSHITIPVYKTERFYSCNDFYNVYYFKCNINAQRLFEFYNIPKKYRKLVLVIRHSPLKKLECFDFLTGVKYHNFNINTTNNFISTFEGMSQFLCLENYYNVKVSTTYTLRDNKEIKEFFDNLKNENLLENYLSAIKELYLISNSKDLNVNTKIEDMTLTRRQIRKKNKNE